MSPGQGLVEFVAELLDVASEAIPDDLDEMVGVVFRPADLGTWMTTKRCRSLITMLVKNSVMRAIFTGR